MYANQVYLFQKYSFLKFTFPLVDHSFIGVSPCETLHHLLATCPEAISLRQTFHLIVEKVASDTESDSDTDTDTETERAFVYLTQIVIVDTFPIEEVDRQKWRSLEKAANNLLDFLSCASLLRDSSGFQVFPLQLRCLQWSAMSNYDLIEGETSPKVDNWRLLLNLYSLCKFPK